jgi:hypothetical protein
MDKLEVSAGFVSLNAQGTTAIIAAFLIVVVLVSLRFQEVMAKCVRSVGSAAEKSEMPGFIKPQLTTPIC